MGESRDELASVALTESELLLVHRRILRACAFSGLRGEDAQDVAQSIWEWLLRTQRVQLAVAYPWLDRVTVNFVRRLWRRRAIQRRVYEEVGRGRSVAVHADPDLAISVDEVLRRMRERDRTLVQLIRNGEPYSSAAEAVGYRPGSRHCVRCRLRNSFRPVCRTGGAPKTRPTPPVSV